jgi:hypothetical protein
MRTSSLLPTAAGAALGALLFLTPLVAQAEEQDLGEVVHAVFIVGIFAMMFVVGLSAGLWLLVVRLRNRGEGSSDKLARSRLNLEGIYFPAATSVASSPSTSSD